MITSGTPYYYVQDGLGSVTQLVTNSGTVASQFAFDPYGNRSIVSGTVTSDVGYAGYFNHAASGLDFAIYRAFDPVHARWLNRDPIGEAGGINLYAYVDGNPLSETDPLGFCGPGKSTEPSKPSCETLAAQIAATRNELAKRQAQLILNELNLPLTGKMSIAGHQQQFQNKQTQLRNLLNQYNSQGCGGGGAGGLPSDAWDLATAPTPNQSNQNAASSSFLLWLIAAAAAVAASSN